MSKEGNEAVTPARAKKRVIVVGGGAAGMMCAALLAERGLNVQLIEHNERLGKKLYITGKGRCNFTNSCSPDEFLSAVLSNPKFLFSASRALTSRDVIDLFESWGVETKVERGRRAFPASDHAADIIDALRRKLKKEHVEIRLGTEALRILTVPEEEQDPSSKRRGPAMSVTGVEIGTPKGREVLKADAVVLATGGLSYPSTGSTGDGYRLAEECGHTVTDLHPSLVPVNCKEEYVRDLQGLSLRNVTLTVRKGKKILFSDFGELLFTHFGISGPLVLSMSAAAGPALSGPDISGFIDLKPALSIQQLDARFVRVLAASPKKALKNVLHEFYPAKLVPVIPRAAGIDDEKRCGGIFQKERERLVTVTKQFPVTPVSLRGYQEAVVTKGGIRVREIDPKTMESRTCRSLYCIGELLDVDAFTGGYNLQIAWSTAAVCARAIAEAEV